MMHESTSFGDHQIKHRLLAMMLKRLRLSLDAYAGGRGHQHDEQHADRSRHPATNLSIEIVPYTFPYGTDRFFSFNILAM
jgi:hypothetical protein